MKMFMNKPKEQLSEDRTYRDLQTTGCPDGINEFKTRIGNKKVRVKRKGWRCGMDRFKIYVDVDRVKEIFSNNLVYYMHKERVSFEELSGLLDLNILTVKNWVDQISLPRAEHLIALTYLSGISADMWFTY